MASWFGMIDKFFCLLLHSSELFKNLQKAPKSSGVRYFSLFSVFGAMDFQENHKRCQEVFQ